MSMSLTQLPEDVRFAILRFMVEDPQTMGHFSCVSKQCSQDVQKVKEWFLTKFNQVCPKPDGISSEVYIQSLYKFVFRDGLYYGRRGVHKVIYFKDLIRFTEELKRGEGHEPKFDYSLCWHECSSGYGSTKDVKERIYFENEKSAITPLAYFKKMASDLDGAYGVPGPKEDIETIYYALYEIRKNANPKDSQLKNSRFGEFAFYDTDTCSSSSQEKSDAVFKLLAKKWELHRY